MSSDQNNLTSQLAGALERARAFSRSADFTKMRGAVAKESKAAGKAAKWISKMPSRARDKGVFGVAVAEDPGPPPQMPDPQQIMDEAQRRAIKYGTITAGVAAWKEGFELYKAYKRGAPLNGFVLWSSTKRVGERAFAAASYAGRRHMLVVGLDTAARVIAWQTAQKASKSALAKAIHVVAKRFAGRASIAVAGVEIFLVMHKDIKRFRSGELSQNDFYRNCALTGFSIAAPLAGGAMGGPVGATVGSVIAVGAGYLKK